MQQAVCWPAFWGGTPARRHKMAIEISVIIVGAVLVVLLLMVVICTSGQRSKSVQKGHMGSKDTGNYLFVVFVWSSWSLQSSIFISWNVTMNEWDIFSTHWKVHHWTWSNGFCLFYLCVSQLLHPVVKSGLLQYLYQFLPCSSSPSLPGPPSLFLIGNMMELTHDHLPIHLTNLTQRYGNIYRLKCGNTSNHTRFYITH